MEDGSKISENTQQPAEQDLTSTENNSITHVNRFYRDLKRYPETYSRLNEINSHLLPSDIEVFKEDTDIETTAILPDTENKPTVLADDAGTTTILVATNQAVIGNVNSTNALATASLESCVAFAFRLEEIEANANQPGQARVLLAHTASFPKKRFQELIKIVSKKYKIIEIGISVPLELSQQVEEVTTVERDDNLKAKIKVLERRRRNGGIVVSNQGIVFLDGSYDNQTGYSYSAKMKYQWH